MHPPPPVTSVCVDADSAARPRDAQALPFPDRCFDAVVSNLGLPHFGRPEQAVAEVRRV